MSDTWQRRFEYFPSEDNCHLEGKLAMLSVFDILWKRRFGRSRSTRIKNWQILFSTGGALLRVKRRPKDNMSAHQLFIKGKYSDALQVIFEVSHEGVTLVHAMIKWLVAVTMLLHKISRYTERNWRTLTLAMQNWYAIVPPQLMVLYFLVVFNLMG